MTPIRLLHLLSLAVALCLMAAYGLFNWRDYQNSLRDAETSLTEVARLMEEHTRAALLAGALQLGRVEDMIGDRPISALEGSEVDWRRLKRMSAEVPYSDSVWIIDAGGQLVLSTLQPAGVHLNVADRAYFTAARDGKREFISPMIWGKLYGGYYLAMSRRLQNPDGGFKGVVQVSLKTSYFTDFYKSLRPEDGASFAIFRDDGGVVARHPLPPPGIETFPRSVELLNRLEEADIGSFVAPSPFDGVEGLFVYRRVAGQPLVVSAGLPVEVVFAGWRERTANSALLALAVLALFGLGVWKLTVTMRREEKIHARAEVLLADKDVLFQEIHHRVKNNLQIVASFLTMQALRAPDAATAEAFREALTRIESMGLVHQTLYEQHEASEVSMDAYLRALIASIGQSYGGPGRGITVEIATDGTRLPLDRAVPLALLANEALTNAFKHAFPQRGGCIRVELERRDRVLSFSISDDGIGLDPAVERKPSAGLGLHILDALAGQLGATLKVDHDDGTRVAVAFPA